MNLNRSQFYAHKNQRMTARARASNKTVREGEGSPSGMRETASVWGLDSIPVSALLGLSKACPGFKSFLAVKYYDLIILITDTHSS